MDSDRRVYDGFLFFNEYELLDMHLHTTEEFVDKWIVVEGTVTHSGKPREINLPKQRDRFARFWDRIIHVVVDDTPMDVQSNFDRQKHQRDAIVRGLQQDGARLHDLVIVGDVDEIPSLVGFQQAAAIGQFCQFDMLGFYYYLNLLMCHDWRHSYLANVEEVLTHGPTALRHMGCAQLASNGGWHFSYMGGPDAIRTKLQSFGAAETLDRPEVLGNVEHAMQRGRPPWDTKEEDYPRMVLKINGIYPKYVRDHQARLEAEGWIL